MLLPKSARHLLLGVLSLPGAEVAAQALPITADKSIHGSTPLVGASHDVPVIHIAPPSAAGVSHNRFTEFNVGPSGVVLNNSGGASATQIAGQIAGNPMLGNRHAKTILNQVTAPNPSILQGMLEVAGHRANVVLANPAGITCNGCGFLNAARATLTTGRPDIGPKGNIAYDIASGQLQIEGRGLNGIHVERVDLMARALVINAGVWADRLHVIAGAARVEASGEARAIAGQGTAPAFSVDTAALGGMYANSIRLIGTEAGVGVNIGGNLVALTGDLTVSAAGVVRIAPSGALSAKKKISISTSDLVDTRQAALHAANVGISAHTLRNQQGSITATDSVTLRVRGELDNARGLIAAAGNHKINAKQLNNNGGTLAGGDLSLTVKAGIDNRKGVMLADNALTVSAARLLNDGTLGATRNAATAATATSEAVYPLGISGNAVDLRASYINNTKGAIHARSDLTITAAEFKNPSGVVSSNNTARIDAQTLRNKAGTLAAGQQLSVSVTAVDGLGRLQSDADITFGHRGSLSPRGSFMAGRDLTLDLGGTLSNKARLSAGRDLHITANALNNASTGELLAGRHHTLAIAQSVTNAGLIDGQSTSITASQLNNRGRIYGDRVSLRANELVNDAGPKGSARIASRGSLDLGVGSLINRHHSVLYAQGDLRVGGSLDAVQQATGQAAHVQNLSATIEAGRHLSISAHQIQNQNAHFATADVQVSAKPKVYFTPEGSTDMLDAASHWLCDTVTRGCSRRPEWLDDDPERRLLMPSRKYPPQRYGPPFDYAPNEKGRAGYSSPIALTYTPPGRSCVGRVCDPTPERFRYPRDAHVWAVFGVEPPPAELPSWQDFERRSSNRAQLRQQRQAYEASPQYRDFKARHMTLEARIKAFNRDFHSRLVPHFTFYEVNEIVTRTRTVRSDPGRILSAGALSLNGVVTNDKSQIAAGGLLSVQGPAIHNIGATGWQTVTREGQATFTQARGSDRKAHRAPYRVTLTGQPFDLPVGPVRSVGATKVQLPARLDTSQTYGTLMAGRNTHLSAAGGIFNSGTLGAREVMVMNAQDIVNHSGGQLLARNIDLAARENLSNLAAQIAGHTVSLRAGKNINLISAEAFEDNGSTQGKRLSGVSTVTANDLTLQAGNDINMLAALVSVEHHARLLAGRDIRMEALTSEHRERISSGAHQRHELRTSHAIGSSASAKGDLALAAGQDIEARAAQINAQQKLSINAGRDVLLQAGMDSGAATDRFREKQRGLLSSKTTDTLTSMQWERPSASTITGHQMEIIAGRDVTVQGSNVGAREGLDISAARNVNIDPRHSKTDSQRIEHVKKSGLGATGGLGVGIHKKKHTVQESAIGNAPSTLGSLTGNTTIHTGKALNVTAGLIVAPRGDITMTGEQVTIGAAQDTHHRQESLYIKQAGVSVGIQHPLLNTMQTVNRIADAADKSDSPVMQGLAAAAAAMESVNAYGMMKNLASAENGAALKNAGSIRVSVNLGASQQFSKTEVDSSHAVGSTVAAGKDIAVIATGAGEHSNIDIEGSTLSARHRIDLKSDGSINLRAAENTLVTRQNNGGSSASIGVAANVGTGDASFGFEIGGSYAKGRANGRDRTMTNTYIAAGENLGIHSGADTHMRGAVASGRQVAVEVGGDLSIESLQDTSVFDDKNQQVGGSAVVGAGVSGGASYAQSNVKGDYASVREQSGIQAGDGGFDVNVNGNTHLKGAVIASTEAAVQAGMNRVKTGTLTVSDIENRSEFKASGVSLSGGFSTGGAKKDTDKSGGNGADTSNGNAAANPPVSGSGTHKATTPAGAGSGWASQNTGKNIAMIAPGMSQTSGSAQSTTRSGISGATVSVIDHQTQYALTGKTASELLASLDQDIRSGASAGGLSKSWDPEKLRSKVAAEAEIVAAFSQHANQAIRSYTEEKRTALRKQIAEKTDDQEKQNLQQQISALNTQERMMNVVVGALTGSVGVAALHAGLSEAADQMREYTIADSKKFAGITDGETTLDNQSGQSAGIRGDGFKAAGVRVVLDSLCGRLNQHCATQDKDGREVLDEHGVPRLIRNEQNMIFFSSAAAGKTLDKFLDDKSSKEMSGFTGGVQGREGTLGGKPYRPGGLLDLIHESFAGPHDFIGGTISGFYDKEGNARRGLSAFEKKIYEGWSGVALIPATPFALSEILPPEAWDAINILLKLKK